MPFGTSSPAHSEAMTPSAGGWPDSDGVPTSHEPKKRTSQGAAGPAVFGPKKRRRNGPRTDIKCSNCGTSKSAVWRRKKGTEGDERVCNREYPALYSLQTHSF